ncbi:hypothetical protein M422DRAFT_49346 [Sphaerobolus stellatus SS14]|uniref:Uncharacterized protein n=1 Tax=Sphaerobolus stellatus (strain SS14) TaxID=990650 RepID=A0A0C9UYR7_SPHS4|nr:hypothetical protein M422DRAFT_49346 [Sphaerobolus stellatus SS14]
MDSVLPTLSAFLALPAALVVITLHIPKYSHKDVSGEPVDYFLPTSYLLSFIRELETFNFDFGQDEIQNLSIIESLDIGTKWFITFGDIILRGIDPSGKLDSEFEARCTP